MYYHTLPSIRAKCKKYINDPMYVYGCCQNNIIVMRRTPQTRTNEKEESTIMVDISHASFLTNKMSVTLIIDITNTSSQPQNLVDYWIDTVTRRNLVTCYEVGKTTVVYKDEVGGETVEIDALPITYYRTVETAFGKIIEENGPGNFTGLVTVWHKNGQKSMEGSYIDGMKLGRWMTWRSDGKLESESYYSDDKIVGEIVYF